MLSSLLLNSSTLLEIFDFLCCFDFTSFLCLRFCLRFIPIFSICSCCTSLSSTICSCCKSLASAFCSCTSLARQFVLVHHLCQHFVLVVYHWTHHSVLAYHLAQHFVLAVHHSAQHFVLVNLWANHLVLVPLFAHYFVLVVHHLARHLVQLKPTLHLRTSQIYWALKESKTLLVVYY